MRLNTFHLYVSISMISYYNPCWCVSRMICFLVYWILIWYGLHIDWDWCVIWKYFCKVENIMLNCPIQSNSSRMNYCALTRPFGKFAVQYVLISSLGQKSTHHSCNLSYHYHVCFRLFIEKCFFSFSFDPLVLFSVEVHFTWRFDANLMKSKFQQSKL